MTESEGVDITQSSSRVDAEQECYVYGTQSRQDGSERVEVTPLAWL